MATLTAVTAPVPSRRVSRSEARLETIVPPAMMIVTMPDSMVGQPAPTRESGSPRLMKAR